MGKSQSALEYMMTYGWAILIIVIVAGVLYSLGIFNPSASASSSAVVGFSGFNVQAQCIVGGDLQMQILNGLGYTVNITGVNTTSSTGQSSNTQKDFITASPGSSVSFYVVNACPSSTGTRYSVSATITYTAPGQTFSGPYFSSGTASGTTVLNRQSQAALFSNGYMRRTLFSPNSWTSGYTISAWVYYTAPINCGYAFGISNTSTQPRFGLGYSCGTGSGEPYGETINSTGNNHGSGRPSALNNNTWYYLVAVWWPTSNVSIYVNGSLKSSAADSHTVASVVSAGNNYFAYIGSTVSGTNFNGKMADIQVYNKPLTQTQISQLYSEGLGGGPITTSGLVAWYPLNGNALDYSGNGNNMQTFVGISYTSP